MRREQDVSCEGYHRLTPALSLCVFAEFSYSNIMFIETICSDAIVEKNIRAVKLQSPDVGCSSDVDAA